MVDGLKTFRGKSVADALDQVKRQFGRPAVILNTRTVSCRGVLGLGTKPYVETTAARGMNDLPASMRKNGVPIRPGATGGSFAITRPRSLARSEEGVRVDRPAVERGPDSEALLSEVASLKGLIGELVYETRRARNPGIQ